MPSCPDNHPSVKWLQGQGVTMRNGIKMHCLCVCVCESSPGVYLDADSSSHTYCCGPDHLDLTPGGWSGGRAGGGGGDSCG